MVIARIIIVNFNSGIMLRRCLMALVEQTETQFEVIIVDNGSSDTSLAGLPNDPRLRILPLNQNIGFAGASNRGFDGCTTPFAAFLNPDTVPDRGWLAALLQVADRFPEAAMFGSLQLCDDNPSVLDGAGDVYHCAGTAWRGGYLSPVPMPPPEGETFAPCAAAAMYRSEWFRQAGGFDERYFCYYEDVDLAFRVRLLGGRCLQVGDAVVRHVGSAVSGFATPFTIYHLNRNQVWTFVKCMPGPLFWSLLPLHIIFVLICALRTTSKCRNPAAWDGLRDCLRGLSYVWRQRRQIQRNRCVSWLYIARRIAWSPFAVTKRAIVLWPWEQPVGLPRTFSTAGGR